MKATGIVRRIDDLGRVVIPKEIRRTLRIREGDPLEIFTEREGSVILRKYSPIGEIGAVAGLYAESLAHTMNCIVCLTDMDQIVAASGNGSKELLNRYISKELEYAIQARKQIRTEKRKADYIPIFAGGEEYSQEIICPIISGGDEQWCFYTKKNTKNSVKWKKKWQLWQQNFWADRWNSKKML